MINARSLLVVVSLVLGSLGCSRFGSHTTGDAPTGTTPPSSDSGTSAAGAGAGGSGAGAAGSGTGSPGAGGSGEFGSTDAAPITDGAGQTVILTLGSADDAPIAAITNLVVTITEDGSTRMMTFPHDPQQPIDGRGLVTLSVSISAPVSGMAAFTVDARNASGCTVATRLISVSLPPDPTVHADVSLLRLPDCPAGGGGAPDGGAPGANGVFAGCDPAGSACPDEMTCEVRCATKTAACTAAGSGPHGSPCTSNGDCAPGTQCIDYGASGCAVKVCRHFCDEDVNCPQPLQAGIGKNACAVPLSCSDAATPYHTCTLTCDPTWSASVNGTTSCPAGLSCLMLDLDHADCACPPTTRSKKEGATCATAGECAPGLTCRLEGATQKCRALCRCYAEAGACGAAGGDCPTAGTHCAPLQDGTVYGVCVAI